MGESRLHDTKAALDAAANGDRVALSHLTTLVYEQLRRVARGMMQDRAAGETLQPTALVHEAFLKVVGQRGASWEDRRHFFGAAARAMRDILVDQARRKGSLKRGGGRRQHSLGSELPAIETPHEDVLALDEAIGNLRAEDERKAEIVMLRYFAGLSRAETADVLGVTTRTIDRDWRYIVAFLQRQLGAAETGSGQ